MEPELPHPEITLPLVSDLFHGHAAAFPAGGLRGLYLGGSLATGGFNPATSDLDFLAVTASPVTPGQFTALTAMHRRIRAAAANRLYTNYEGVYLTTEQARGPHSGITAPHLGADGHFAVEEHGAELVIDLWKVRRSGYVVSGVNPAELIGGISPAEFRAAQAGLFTGWWLPKLRRRETMDSAYQAYAALTMARLLYGQAHGVDVSKPDAADWVMQAYPGYAGLVRAALDWRPGNVLDRQEDVYDLISHVHDRLGSGTTD